MNDGSGGGGGSEGRLTPDEARTVANYYGDHARVGYLSMREIHKFLRDLLDNLDKTKLPTPSSFDPNNDDNVMFRGGGRGSSVQLTC